MIHLKSVISHQRIRLVIFDLDGTITRSPNVWRHLHEELGTWNSGRIFAQQYLNGEISYREWAQLDCSLWKGTRLEELLRITSRIEYYDGAAETIKRLREAGIRVGIVSAGISLVAERAGRDLNVDLILSNEILIENGVLTGTIETRVSLDEKPQIIERIAASIGLTMSEVAVVGDNIFDIPRDAAIKIAFNPTSKEVEEAADFVVRDEDLRKVLPLIISEGAS